MAAHRNAWPTCTVDLFITGTDYPWLVEGAEPGRLGGGDRAWEASGGGRAWEARGGGQSLGG